MGYYPLFINISHLHVLVVGAGRVGLRKISSLLACSPGALTVVDPRVQAEELGFPAKELPLTCHARTFSPEDLAGKHLVFAATNNRGVNTLISGLCLEKHILCNSVDAPENGGFIVPAHFDSGGITVALSTRGQSPALARRLRQELEIWMGKRYTPLLLLLGRLRPMLLEQGLPTEDNSRLFRDLVCSSLADHLEKNDRAAAITLLERYLPQALHSHLGELLHGI